MHINLLRITRQIMDIGYNYLQGRAKCAHKGVKRQRKILKEQKQNDYFWLQCLKFESV